MSLTSEKSSLASEHHPSAGRGRQEAAGSAALEIRTQNGGSCGFATPVTETWGLERGAAQGAWVLELCGGKRSAREGISAFDILLFVSCCREAGAGIGCRSTWN